MRRAAALVLLLLLAAAGGLLTGCTSATAGATAGAPAGRSTATPQPGPAGDCHRAESERFVFHDDPWINLHHFLFEWARNVPQRPPGDRGRPVEVQEQAQLGGLDGGERQTWERALGFYRERLAARELLFDRDLIEARGRLGAAACSGAGLDGVEAGLRAVLEEAMPVYRRRWWPRHHAANQAWIRERLDQLKAHEAALAERLAHAYGGAWPAERIRVDVVAYANWAGAYTTNRPNQVTLSAPGYPGLQGLEILFHEVSHASFFEQRILGHLAAAFQRRGAEPPDRLSHMLQFATPPELLRAVLSREDLAGYHSVAGRVYDRGPGRAEYEIVLQHWKPFLAGEISRDEALARIAEALAPQKGGE
jgi:hypothetical protein